METCLSVKTCPACKLSKPVNEFVRHRKGKDGYGSYCLNCHNAKSRAWATNHREETNRRTREYRKSIGYKLIKVRERYGLSYEEYKRMVAEQDGKCLICKKITDLVVDHSHGLCLVRGLLCRACNTGLGSFKDNPSLLMDAATYIRNRTPVGIGVNFFEGRRGYMLKGHKGSI